MTAEEYYKLKVRTIFRAYPAYVEGKEPAGYIESLKQKEPEIIFDPTKLHTKEDWIQAGKIVFESANSFSPARPAPGGRKVSPALSGFVSKDGALPIWIGGPNSYIIRKKGVLEAGSNASANCHTRLMPDGSLLEGAKGNAPIGVGDLPANLPLDRLKQILDIRWILLGAPWVQIREEFDKAMMGLGRAGKISYPGVLVRQGTSASHPPHIPSLIGIVDIRYLDYSSLNN